MILAEATELQELARAIANALRETEPSTNWGLVAILSSVILALAGIISHQVGARFKRQSEKHEELRKLFYD